MVLRFDKNLLPVATILAFIVSILVINALLEQKRDTEIKLYTDEQVGLQSVSWSAISDSFSQGTDIFFNTLILDNPQTIGALIKLKREPSSILEARDILKKQYSTLYEDIKNNGVLQFHFHDANTASLLRLHKPEQYGDKLGDIRTSIRDAKDKQTVIRGFELGRVFTGFRNVYPIVYDGEYLGSVEFSQPYSVFFQKLQNINQNRVYRFIIKKEPIMDIVFDENKKFYKETCFSDEWLFETNDLQPCIELKNSKGELAPLHAFLKGDSTFLEALNGGKPFATSVKSGDSYYTVINTPIVDIDGKYNAALISFGKSKVLDDIWSSYYKGVVYASIVLLIFFILIYLYLKKIAKIKKDKQMLELITGSIGEGLYVMDKEGKIIDINQKACDILGFTKDELMGNIAHYIFHAHPESNTPLEECSIYKTTKQDTTYSGVETFKTKNRGKIPVEVVSRAIFQNSSVIGSVTVFKDISERINREKALEIEKKRLSNIIDATNVGTWEWDVVEGRVELNDRWAQMLGYTLEELAPITIKTWESVVYPEDMKKRYELIKRHFDRESEFYQCECRVKKKNGEYIWIMDQGKVIERDSEGKPLLMCGTHTDISEKKAYESMLEDFNRELAERVEQEVSARMRAEKHLKSQETMLIQQSKLAELGNMMGIIAHQWKQPLNVISLVASMILDKYEENELNEEELQKAVDTISNQTQFMSQTINDFRNFYKPSREKEPFDVVRECQKVISLLTPKLNKESIKLVYEHKNESWCLGYPGEFKQVILNIINNALDELAKKKEGEKKIAISLIADEEYTVINIDDNGGGIDSSIIKDIFEPFVSSKGESGTGIGLSLAKTIIEEKMDGELSASNIDGGARFTLKLPLFRFRN